ncbi:L,D-transpeptidase [Mesorhizobium sp. YM1C-6-2]|uniref:L,D-transpeptidase n=1 Tax=Mesorhizobium sp. YM1C-6-2 TaxID=1827501 RepID=UPI001FE1F667|nr:L,D-transpeptidase [Mesorhizobium sp. YM1C-6-2]
MQFRSLLLLGFGASLAMSVSAYAAPPVPAAPAVVETPVVNVATKAEELKKKKAAAQAKAAAEKEKATSKSAANAKADKAKQAAAKAKADKEKLAQAKAEKDKLAKAKAAKEKELAKAQAAREKQLAAAKAEKEKQAARAKAEREKMLAEKAKAAEERKIRLAKEAEIRKVAREKAAEERQMARAKAAEERRLMQEARVKATEEKRLAKIRAEQERQTQIAAAAEAARQAEISRLVSMDVVQSGNNSELRSEAAVQVAPQQTGLFAGLFGGQQVQKQSMLPETRALDAAMQQRAAKKPFKVRPEFEPVVVQFPGYPRGTIVIDTAAHYLYLVEGTNKARRYAIAVGKDGLQYKGTVRVGDKQEWPRWIPTKEMQAREPAKYARYADGMPGGGANPLGARAIYLYQNGRDTHLRIHGTVAPETIGTNSSNGCFRMINEHVIDLYRRVPVGAEVIVL